jgi:hypothetical protein
MVGDAFGWRIGSGMDTFAWDCIRVNEKQDKQIDFSFLFFLHFCCKLVQAIVLDSFLESGLHDLGSLARSICHV